MKQRTKKKSCVSGLALILMLVFSSFTMIDLHAQETISGTVKGSDGMPLPGVSVLQKGTNRGAATDFDGNFVLTLSPGGKTLVFSYLGFQTQEVAVGNQKSLSIVLKEDVAALDEVVVIGYQKIEREKVLGATSNV